MDRRRWAIDVNGAPPHRDIDVAVLRPEHEVLREYLARLHRDGSTPTRA